MSSAEFYDHFITRQIASGINDRIFRFYRKVYRLGLRKKSSVLEIGCGIGALTFLLCKKIPYGNIEAVDISPKSIAFAQQFIQRKNLHCSVSDILGYETHQKNFDFILMPDVLEHIPVESHSLLFQRIVSWMHENSLLIINLPNPEYIRHDQKYHPEQLQETDQPVYLSALAAGLEQAGILIHSMETCSVWVQNDYQFIVAKKQTVFREVILSSRRTMPGKIWDRLRHVWRKIRFPYPPPVRK